MSAGGVSLCDRWEFRGDFRVRPGNVQLLKSFILDAKLAKVLFIPSNLELKFKTECWLKVKNRKVIRAQLLSSSWGPITHFWHSGRVRSKFAILVIPTVGISPMARLGTPESLNFQKRVIFGKMKPMRRYIQYLPLTFTQTTFDLTSLARYWLYKGTVDVFQLVSWQCIEQALVWTSHRPSF